jgi:hypothetical protein
MPLTIYVMETPPHLKSFESDLSNIWASAFGRTVTIVCGFEIGLDASAYSTNTLRRKKSLLIY